MNDHRDPTDTLFTAHFGETGALTKIEGKDPNAAAKFYQMVSTSSGDSKSDTFNNDEIKKILQMIGENNLGLILARDIEEVNKCTRYGAYKATLLFCGSITELLLYHELWKNEGDANKRYKEINQSKPDKLNLEMGWWSLGDMITVSKDLNIINDAIKRKARDITDYRNIIHPSVEIREEIKLNQIENLARISIELLKMIIKELGEIGSPSE